MGTQPSQEVLKAVQGPERKGGVGGVGENSCQAANIDSYWQSPKAYLGQCEAPADGKAAGRGSVSMWLVGAVPFHDGVKRQTKGVGGEARLQGRACKAGGR